MDNLCASCAGCFDENSTWPEARYEPHYDIQALAGSAESGCHLCHLILSQISADDIVCLKQDLVNFRTSPGDQIGINIRGWPTLTLWVAAFKSSVTRKGWDTCKDGWIALAKLHIRLRQDDYTNEERSISRQNFSSSSIDQVFSWIEECQSDHSLCRDVQSLAATKRILPTRLLDLSSALEDNHVRLCSSQSLGPNIKYVTLSHCWGGLCDKILTKNDKSAFEKGIAVDSLPRTFRDAVEITRRLGLFYLWIDALW